MFEPTATKYPGPENASNFRQNPSPGGTTMLACTSGKLTLDLAKRQLDGGAAGSGCGVVSRSSAADITAYGCRPVWISASNVLVRMYARSRASSSVAHGQRRTRALRETRSGEVHGATPHNSGTRR